MTCVYVLAALFFGAIFIEKIMKYRKMKAIRNTQNKCLHTHREIELIYYPDSYEIYRCADCNVKIYVDMDDGTEEISNSDD